MSVQRIVAAGNTVVPALLSLEKLGFQVSVRNNSAGQTVTATRGDEEYFADDPVTVLGLIKLVEARGWEWKASDPEIGAITAKTRSFQNRGLECNLIISATRE